MIKLGIFVGLISLICFGFFISSNQNKLLKNQKAFQKAQLEQQSSLKEALRKNGLIGSMNRLLTKAEAELKQNPNRQLSNQTIAQIATLSQSFELGSYNHFELDSLFKKKPSFERGQLFMALFQMDMDASSFEKIKSTVSFEGADLNGVNLSSANLAGTNFYCANFKDANLQNASFQNADLRGGNFSYSNLTNANLQVSNLNRANMSWAEINNAQLMNSDLGGINLSNAKLKKANLSGVQLTSANLKVAVLKEAILIGADIRDSDLSRANLIKANLTDANFKRANLSEATLNAAILLNVELTRVGVFTKNWLELLPSWKVIGFEEIQKKYKIADEAPGNANFELGVIPVEK